MDPHPAQAPHPTRPSPGQRWIDAYFIPRLAEQMPGRRAHGLRVLQLEPDDSSEARRLVELGAHVTLAGLASPVRALESMPYARCDESGVLPLPSESVDVIITGHLGRIVHVVDSPATLVRELARVCRVGGGLLAPLATRCPLNLSGDGPLLGLNSGHSTVRTELASAFGEVRLLSIAGHFGWSSGSPVRRVVGRMLDAYWRHLATPRRKWLYASALNPVMLVWARKQEPSKP